MAYIQNPHVEAALAGDGDLVKLAADAFAATASPALIEKARDLYQDDDCEIDDDASTSESDAGTWVQAWVFVPEGEAED